VAAKAPLIAGTETGTRLRQPSGMSGGLLLLNACSAPFLLQQGVTQCKTLRSLRLERMSEDAKFILGFG
jgi:hypothetical protein